MFFTTSKQQFTQNVLKNVIIFVSDTFTVKILAMMQREGKGLIYGGGNFYGNPHDISLWISSPVWREKASGQP